MKQYMRNPLQTAALSLGVIAMATFVALPAMAQDMRSYTDALGRTVDIPVEPQRIVSTHDWSMSIPLVELGAPLVGSAGRIDENGNPYMINTEYLFGVGISEDGINYIGRYDAWDLEAIAALEPDLILVRASDTDFTEQLEAIGPTVYIEQTPEPFVTYAALADVVGMTEEFEDLRAGYDGMIAQARANAPELQGATYSKIMAWDTELAAYVTYGGLTQLLADLGAEPVALVQDMKDRGVIWAETVRTERFQDLDADYIFSTYPIADGPAAEFASLNALLPGWCDLLTACAEGRYILMPRDYSGYTFREFETGTQFIVSHVAGRPGVAAAD